ncbi:hypothetical protein ACFL96_09895 [Thermoproteota archaeon]
MTVIEIKLFTYLKHVDLTCLSTFDAITNLLKFHHVLKLRRLIMWNIGFELNSEEQALAEIKKIIQQTFYLLNPNKEAYNIDTLPKPDCPKNTYPELIQIIPKTPADYSGFIKKIKQKTDSPLSKIKKTLVWEFIIEPSVLIKEEIREKLFNDVVVSSAWNKGLLINPVYEDAEFLESRMIYNEHD